MKQKLASWEAGENFHVSASEWYHRIGRLLVQSLTLTEVTTPCTSRRLTRKSLFELLELIVDELL